MRLGVVALVLVLGGAAPPPGSPQADELAPFAGWITNLKNPTTGQGCCSMADCRAVQYRIRGDSYEAFIGRDVFDRAPDAWVKVPDSVILHRPNPTGLAIACWSYWHRDSAGFFCFSPTDGT